MCFVVFPCRFLYSCQKIVRYIHLMNFSPFKASFMVKILPKISWGSRFEWKAVLFRLTTEKRRSSPAFEWRSDTINFVIGKRRLNCFVPSADVIWLMRFHTISIRSAISEYFSFNGDFHFLLKAETCEILVAAHPFPREKITMLGTNAWI